VKNFYLALAACLCLTTTGCDWSWLPASKNAVKDFATKDELIQVAKKASQDSAKLAKLDKEVLRKDTFKDELYTALQDKEIQKQIVTAFVTGYPHLKSSTTLEPAFKEMACSILEAGMQEKGASLTPDELKKLVEAAKKVDGLDEKLQKADILLGASGTVQSKLAELEKRQGSEEDRKQFMKELAALIKPAGTDPAVLALTERVSKLESTVVSKEIFNAELKKIGEAFKKQADEVWNLDKKVKSLAELQNNTLRRFQEFNWSGDRYKVLDRQTGKEYWYFQGGNKLATLEATGTSYGGCQVMDWRPVTNCPPGFPPYRPR